MSVTLQEAIAAIQSGDRQRGRQLLAQLLLQDPNNEDAWIWMSGTVDNPQQRRDCLEKVLAINPTNVTALAGMAQLSLSQPDIPPPTPPLTRADHGLGQPAPQEASDLPQTPAFVWPTQPIPENETPEVEETFIGDIVAAMNKDENGLASGQEAGEESDLDWLLQPAEGDDSQDQAIEQALRRIFAATEEEPQTSQSTQEALPTPPAPPQLAAEDLPQEAEEAAQAEAPEEPEAPPAPAEPALPAEQAAESGELPTDLPHIPPPPEAKLWHNPAARSGQLVILAERALVTASPDPRRLPKVEAMLAEGQIQRKVLGRGAKTIPLDRITLVSAGEKSPTLEVSYQGAKSAYTHPVTLSTPAQRDELLKALESRLVLDFRARTVKTGLWDRLFVPALTLLVLVAIFALLSYGALQLVANPGLLSGLLPQTFVTWLESDQSIYLPLGVALVGVILILLGILGLVNSLRKPRRRILLERITNLSTLDE